MARTPATAPDATPLPDLDSIASVAIEALPAPSKASPLTDAETAFATKVVEAGSNGSAAVGPRLADRKEANASAARVRRLVNRHIAAQGTPPADRPTVKTRIVPKDGGVAWAITLTAPETVAESATDNAIMDAASAPTD